MLSASNCVAKMTLTFFPEVLSHCRMRAVKDGSSRNSHASLRISNVGTLSKQTRGSCSKNSLPARFRRMPGVVRANAPCPVLRLRQATEMPQRHRHSLLEGCIVRGSPRTANALNTNNPPTPATRASAMANSVAPPASPSLSIR